MLILDTNVLSEMMRPKPDPQFAKWFANQSNMTIATTVICVAEITFGLARLPIGDRRTRLEKSFLTLTGPVGPVQTLEVLREDGHLAGILRARREATGRSITLADALIGAIALNKSARLATRNMADFEELGIDLTDPWELWS